MSHRSVAMAKARLGRAVGATSAAGAFLAFGMTPLTAAPASADFDFLGDLFSWIEPSAANTAGFDWSGFDAIDGGFAGSAAASPLDDLNALVANTLNTVI